MSRELFRPKYPELRVQCPSCPFRKGNDAEFGKIVTGLIGHKACPADVALARANIKSETKSRGDFICHKTVYTEEMEMAPQDEWRQCPGATAFYKGTDPMKEGGGK